MTKTRNYPLSGGRSETWTFDGYGKATSVVVNDGKGNSQAHHVARGIFGPYRGSKK